MGEQAKHFDLHSIPIGALLALVLGAGGALLGHAFRSPVHARLAAALTGELEDAARFRESLVALELWAVMALDALAFISIQLARCGCNLPPRSGLLRRLAGPRLLNVEWLLACVTFAVQVVLLVVYVCFLQLFRVLGALCASEDGTCAVSIGEQLQPDFPGLDAKKFCQYDLGGIDPVSLFVSGCLMTVIGQGLMASSLTAEWERVSEELHHQDHDEADTEPLAPHGQAAEPDSRG